MMKTSTFIPVLSDGTETVLGDVKVTNFDAVNNDMLQFFADDGSGTITKAAVYWAGWGWYNFEDEDEEWNEMPIPTGIGYIARASQAGAKLNVSGEVAMDEFALALPTGFTIGGNCLPRDLELGDIDVVSFNAVNNDMLQFFADDGSGTIEKAAVYWDGWGWYNFEDEDEDWNEMSVPAGAAFIARASKAGAALLFPKAIP